jgi:hypothetical protein
MSLLSTASPWNNDKIQTRKRTPTMKRVTAKVRPYDNGNKLNNDSLPNEEETTIESMQDLHKSNEENTSRIKNFIDKLAADNDGDKLANYVPLEPPHMNSISENDVQKDMMSLSNLQMDANELLPKTLERQQNSDFSSNDISLANLSNYMEIYQAPPKEPYYARMGIGGGSDKMMEKINYMIHLLEEQKMEKTANVTEEFILYTFLGVFVIFVVDSFTKTGKYTR